MSDKLNFTTSEILFLVKIIGIPGNEVIVPCLLNLVLYVILREVYARTGNVEIKTSIHNIKLQINK